VSSFWFLFWSLEHWSWMDHSACWIVAKVLHTLHKEWMYCTLYLSMAKTLGG